MKKIHKTLLISSIIASTLVISSALFIANTDFSTFKIDANTVNNNPCYLKDGYQELETYLSQTLPTSSTSAINIKTRATVTRVATDGTYQYAFLQRTNPQTNKKSSVYAYRLPKSPSLEFNDVIDIEAKIYNYKNLPEITTTYTHFSKLDVKNPNAPEARLITKDTYSQLTNANMSEFVKLENVFITSVGAAVTSNSSVIIVNGRMSNTDVQLIINTMNKNDTNEIASTLKNIVGNTEKAINLYGNYYTKTVNNVEYRGISISSKDDFEIVDATYDGELGYYKQDELSIVASDLLFPNATGDLKTLIIPFNLSDKTAWKSSEIATLQEIFFDDTPNISGNTITSYPSFKEYYETASFNQLSMSGLVTTAFNSGVRSTAVNNDETYETLFDILKDAVSWAQKQYPNEDWTKYDTNNDGYVDNVHLISNYEVKNSEWGIPLWPHMYQTGFDPVQGELTINTYTVNAKNASQSDAYTTIHEQGHVFGLEDYYNYSEENYQADYVGYADMQSGNIFDWNSFSKLSIGWVKPYVVNGELDETTITINPAATSGDCIIVPANHSTWNGSAYDEYFLIELFNTSLGNNLYNKSDYNYEISDFGETLSSGIRLYHVDARLWEAYSASNRDLGREIPDATTLNDKNTVKVNVRPGTNNSYNSIDYNPTAPSKWDDFKLLTLIQKGAGNEFGTGSRNFLTDDDLFTTGDKFTFSKYKHYLSKKGKTVTTMDNGETFPYEIEFVSVTSSKATVTIKKVN